MARRSRLPGLLSPNANPIGICRSCSCAASRFFLPSATSSYKRWAISADPRRSATSFTRSCHSSGPCRRRISSPACTDFARFARSPLTSTLPPSMASAANARVLKNRAAQSHLSRRMGAAGAFSEVNAAQTRAERGGVKRRSDGNVRFSFDLRAGRRNLILRRPRVFPPFFPMTNLVLPPALSRRDFIHRSGRVAAVSALAGVALPPVPTPPVPPSTDDPPPLPVANK